MARYKIELICEDLGDALLHLRDKFTFRINLSDITGFAKISNFKAEVVIGNDSVMSRITFIGYGPNEILPAEMKSDHLSMNIRRLLRTYVDGLVKKNCITYLDV